MGVERVDYSSEDEFRQAQEMEESQYRVWAEEQQAREEAELAELAARDERIAALEGGVA